MEDDTKLVLEVLEDRVAQLDARLTRLERRPASAMPMGREGPGAAAMAMMGMMGRGMAGPQQGPPPAAQDHLMGIVRAFGEVKRKGVKLARGWQASGDEGKVQCAEELLALIGPDDVKGDGNGQE